MFWIDLDNLWGDAKEKKLEYDLGRLINHFTVENTGIDRVVAVHVFTTDAQLKSGHPYTPRYQVYLADKNRYCIHSFKREKNERGYPDEEMYRNAWHFFGQYETGVFISNDKGIAEAAAQLRSGIDPFSRKRYPVESTPEVLVVSSFRGKTEKWIRESDAIDLDEILYAQGIRGPVNRPIQP